MLNLKLFLLKKMIFMDSNNYYYV